MNITKWFIETAFIISMLPDLECHTSFLLLYAKI